MDSSLYQVATHGLSLPTLERQSYPDDSHSDGVHTLGSSSSKEVVFAGVSVNGDIEELSVSFESPASPDSELDDHNKVISSSDLLGYKSTPKSTSDTNLTQSCLSAKVKRNTRSPYSKRVCTLCMTRKKKCSGEHPCSRCIQLGKGNTCSYDKKDKAAVRERKVPLDANTELALVSIRNDLLSVYSQTVVPSLSIVQNDVAPVLSDATMDLVDNKYIGDDYPVVFGLRAMIAIAASYVGCDQVSSDSVHLCESFADLVLCQVRTKPCMGHTAVVVAMGFFHLHYYFYGIDVDKALKFGLIAMSLMEENNCQSNLFSFLHRVLKWSLVVSDDTKSAYEKKSIFLDGVHGANKGFGVSQEQLSSSLGILDPKSIVENRVGNLCLPRLYDLIDNLGCETTSFVDEELEKFRLVNKVIDKPVKLLTVCTKGMPCNGVDTMKVLYDDEQCILEQLSLLTSEPCLRNQELAYTTFVLLAIRARALEAIGYNYASLETAQLAVTLVRRCKLSAMHPGYVTCLSLVLEVLIRRDDEVTIGYLANIMGQNLLVKEGGLGSLYPNTNLRALWWISSSRCSGEAFAAGREMLRQEATQMATEEAMHNL